MKKFLSVLLACTMIFGLVAFAGCGDKEAAGDKFEIAVVTDVGQLMDGGFNQGTWEGAKNYAEAHKITYKYYQPANGSDATDNDRIAAMRLAIDNGAKIIVAPGFLQFNAMSTVAKENPDVKFVFVDGWSFGEKNVTAVIYKEQESGYMAGYAAVMDGYTKLGATLGGGGGNPACNRFGYGYVQGAAAAAAEKNVDVDMIVSYKYGSAFSASTELQTQIAGWYANGTEVVFSCGGSMVNSVKAAAEETTNGKMIGVDTNQSGISERVITSAVKGLATSVEIILGKFYDGKWDAELADQAVNLGASDNATGLPDDFSRFTSFNKAAYDALFTKVANGSLAIKSETPDDCDDESFWTNAVAGTRVKITLDK
ncbi:MAG: BMP family ABC transporter substrate-binding protein [Lachnospiraceae bacterium]|nr:BMP family ABC transporter substrate-binding protein [Lachnospiraceae bacterium]